MLLKNPFIPPPDEPVRIELTTGSGSRTLEVPPGNHFSIQADRFARAILDDTPVPYPLKDALNNMLAIEKIRGTAEAVDV